MDELENLLEESVAKQLVADVPVGILLSGGWIQVLLQRWLLVQKLF